MKIAIVGYGKMGKTIEKLALEKGHEIVLKIGAKNFEELNAGNLQLAEVVIEFSNPENAFQNIIKCLDAGIPVVSGTTGWLNRMGEAKSVCEKKGGAFFYASNFSIGVNIFFEVNHFLAKMMNEQTQYNVQMEEIHHTQKLDTPSGTAITLAKGILEKISRKQKWVNEPEKNPEDLSIFSKRIDKVPGTHQINYCSDIDTIEIKHTAHSRIGFASGAIMAAEWIIDKKGYFEMKDLLGFR